MCLGSLSKQVDSGTTIRIKSTGPREQRAREEERKPGTTNQKKPGRGQWAFTEMVGFNMYLVLDSMGRSELKELINVC